MGSSEKPWDHLKKKFFVAQNVFGEKPLPFAPRLPK